MESFFEKLANSNLGGPSSDHLKLLGKRAARMYLEKEADSPTEAVRSAVEGEDLSKEQVHRVTEMANQALWRAEFHEGGNASTHFEPADPATVIGSMAAKPETVLEDEGSLDYYNDVPNQSLPDDFDLADAFGVKVDSPEYEKLNPAGEEQAKVEKTASAVDLARHGVDLVAGQLVEAGEDFYQMVKRAHLTDGLGILQISQAVGQAVQDPSFGIELMKTASARLESEGVKFNEKQELRKLAHVMVVNTDHPLMRQAAVVEKLAFAHYSAEGSLEDLRAEHVKAASQFRAKLRRK
ncbi:MAG TPA: hypothetical protein VLA34_12280 [Candidatus Krumholzibacterium sp.]|nr:hypothetical protein [Candidatus Krumholzibacterium sp.]